MEARKPELSVSTDIVAPIDKSMPKGIYKCREFGKIDIFLKPTTRVFNVIRYNQSTGADMSKNWTGINTSVSLSALPR